MTLSGLKEMLANYWLFLLLAAVLVTGFLLFRSRPTDLADESALNAVLGDGKPTIVELYSNF